VQVAQQPAWFDFPRKRLPNHVHYTGPWKEPSGQQDGSFPWERLDRRPLIYASLGTLQNRLGAVFRTIAEACVGLPVQLVIALGAKGAVAPSDLAGDPIVVDYAPQVELLARASLVITHGGLNTVLESLGAGLPMIALPITNDQPGVASRIEFLGLGRQIPIEKLTAKVLREAVVALLSAAEVRLNARKYADKIVQGSNQTQAAELVERALTERRRITRAES
jgi:MGT family glycosyltransferase